MDQLLEVLELSIILEAPPPDAAGEVLATIALHLEQFGLIHTGVLSDPLSLSEQEDLHWYLEEYWKWPYLEFASRGAQSEALLSIVGRRLYQAVLGGVEARKIVQAWQRQRNIQHQISIVCTIPGILQLPWELLADAQGFLVLQTDPPISIVRRLPRPKRLPPVTSFQLPLRILMITARPENSGEIDPRGISRVLVDTLQAQAEAGNVVLEFLRPPTFGELCVRLRDKERPVHVLHFDGHGGLSGQKQEGMLLFEGKASKPVPIEARALAKELKNSDIRLVVLTACQTASETSEGGVFSSVALQLISDGVGAVIAMSSSFLVSSAARYTEAFYHALAEGLSVSLAHERARLALHKDPTRHPFRRYQDEDALPVRLLDWWVPHFYQQDPWLFQLSPPGLLQKQRAQLSSTVLYVGEDVPVEPPYGFGGRASELLQIERSLQQAKVMVLHGFAGIGKTALACEAAHWLTRTHMYGRAFFVSFEHGGDASWLLYKLGHALSLTDVSYNPADRADALARLKPVLGEQSLLMVIDNLESILPAGEVPLKPEELEALWEVLNILRTMGAGIILTTRDSSFIAGWPVLNVARLQLQGLQPDDAYLLASYQLAALGIERRYVPYVELRALLSQLDNHPLAIELVLPMLHDHAMFTVRADFAALLAGSKDDAVSGRPRSLTASLDYALRRISEKQRQLLPLLIVFEGGANQNSLLDITGISEDDWVGLRTTLERAALLSVEYERASLLSATRIDKPDAVPFLRFHPVLLPYLRTQISVSSDLRQRYALHYFAVANFLYDEDFHHPELVRSLVRRELPNLRRALEILLQEDMQAEGLAMANSLARFLTLFGMIRECEQLLKRVAPASAKGGTILTALESSHEITFARNELVRGNTQAALTRFTSLLNSIPAQHGGSERGAGSYYHCTVLKDLARCLQDLGQYPEAEACLREALTLLAQLPESNDQNLRSLVYMDLGTVLAEQGSYTQAQQSYEQARHGFAAVQDRLNEAVIQHELGYLAMQQGDYVLATARLQQAQKQFRRLGEPVQEANAWHELGIIAQRQERWIDAEECYRKSLMLRESSRSEDTVLGAALTYYQLGKIAAARRRYAEAEGWYQRALTRFEHVAPESIHLAKVLSGLALIYEDQARNAEAATLLKRALLIQEQQLGIKDPVTLATRIHYASDLQLASAQQVKASKGKRGGWKRIFRFF